MSGLIIENGILIACTSRDTNITVPDGVHTIGENAFKGCVSLEEVFLPDFVTHIMQQAFKGCRKLRSINFPDSLIHIGDYAFHRCHSLLNIQLPPSVTTLGNCVFLFCDNLISASIPGVVNMGNQAFYHNLKLQTITVSADLNPECICDTFIGCNQLKTICYPDGTTFAPASMLDLLSPQNDAPDLIRAIAKDIYRIMEIENGCLVKFLTNLTHAEIPEGITSLGKSSFFDKKGMISIKLPASLTHIDCRAFRNCINLEKITFGNDQLTVSPDAFKNCTTLKYVELPDGTQYELSGLPDHTASAVPPLIRIIHKQILGNFFISGTMLIEYRGSEERVVIPDGITTIGERAFAGNEAIGRIILPDSVLEIHEEAFADCLLLQKINLPEHLQRMDKSAFENCVKLIHIDLPDSLEVLAESVFNRCTKLNAIHFGSALRSIDDLAFYGCSSLKNVDLPSNLESLGDMAFYKCQSLKEITLPASLKMIGSNAFSLSGIRSATVSNDISDWGNGVFSQCPKLRKVTLEEGVSHLGMLALAGCPSLKYVNLPDSLQTIGAFAFKDSAYEEILKEQTTLGTIFLNGQSMCGEISLPEGITAIAGGAFYGNEEITAIQLPESLGFIGEKAFGGCTGLTQINLPVQVTGIEKSTFAWCESLKEVSAHSRLKKIAAKAFYGCTSLKTVRLTADTIEEDVFFNTTFLAEGEIAGEPVLLGDILLDGSGCTGAVTLPEHITTIAPYAFAGNQAITEILFPKGLVSIGKGAFYGCSNLYNISGECLIQQIDSVAFGKCSKLSHLALKSHQIGEQAFSFCTELETVKLPLTTTLGKEAFLGCGRLSSFQGKKIRLIGARCFEACHSLSTFLFPDDCSISAHAFEGCSGITGIQVSGEMLSLGSYAFSGCTMLDCIEINGITYKINGYRTLEDASLPVLVKELYHSSVSCFSIDEDLCLYRCTSRADKLRIPDGVRSIAREVFRNAMQLEDLIIPASVEDIGARAFHSTPWLNQLSRVTPMVIINHILVDAAACQGVVTIPADIKQISGWAFANCYGLTSVIYESAQTKTGEHAFRNCFQLNKITLADHSTYSVGHISDRDRQDDPPLVRQIITDCFNCFKTDENGVLTECTGNIAELHLVDGITAIGDKVFKESNLLTDIMLSEDTEAIGEAAFEQCKWLVRVVQAEAVKRIGKRAFSCCTRLEYIGISDQLEFIGERAFEHCVSLKSLVIPEGITEIPAKAFYRCKNLEYVSFPSTLKTIGSESFAYCPHLSEQDLGQELLHQVSIAPDAFRKAAAQ